MKEKHQHIFLPTETHVPIRRYVFEKGKGLVKDTITAKDILKQLKCKCGATTTVDLERKKA